jgi:Na+-translocating ferredoxin:NAD+ oxidoreductase RNF subunit RnfB
MLVPALVMLGLGLGAAGILAVAAKVFYVEIDPRITEVEDALPGANCGGCGFSGCSACASSKPADWTSPTFGKNTATGSCAC